MVYKHSVRGVEPCQYHTAKLLILHRKTKLHSNRSRKVQIICQNNIIQPQLNDYY